MREIVALGDLNLDLIFYGIKGFPKLGTEILAERCEMKPGGSSANTAIVLKRMGCQAALYSEVGDDQVADYILAALAREGLDTSTISRASGKGTGVTVALTYPEDRMYLTGLGNLSSLSLGNLKAGYVRSGGHLHLASPFLQPALRAEIGRLLQEARKAGMSTSLDPGHDPSGRWDLGILESSWGSLDWFLPNAEELMAITRAGSLDEALHRFSPETKTVVVKNGAGGAVIRDNGTVSVFPAQPTTVVDTCCAGDCFNAGFLYAMASGRRVAEAVRMGNACGAIAVSRVGLPTAEECRSLVGRKE